MLDRLIAFSLRQRLLVVTLACLAMVYGWVAIRELPVDVLPDLNRPTVTVFAEAEGLSPEEVENLVAYPIEAALNGATGVERVRSVSAAGLGIVFVEFGWSTDIHIDRQVVSEKLQSLRETLPPGVTPTLGPIASIMGEIMLISISGDSTHSPMALRELADWVIKPRLTSLPGVAQVIAIGGDRKQVHVQVSAERLKALGITFHEVEEAVRQTNRNGSGGFMDQGPTEAVVRSLGRAESLEDLAMAVVAYRNGQAITLDQVATFAEGTKQKRGSAGANGKPAVILSIKKQPGAGTLPLSEAIDQSLAALKPQLPAGVEINPRLFRQDQFIRTALGNVQEALRDGTILVMVVLFLFLLNLRTTFITLTAIPLSLVLTAFIFKAFGLSINTMTLGGLAVAIGELVDDAVVDVENIFRRLRENRQLPTPRPALQVIYAASSEVRNSIVFATILVVLVFIPLFSMGGIEGRIFAPLGIAYIVSILASLLVSLTVTPALSAYLLPRMKKMAHNQDGPLVRMLKAIDKRFVLRYSLRYPKVSVALAALALAAALASTPFLGREFLPPFNEGTATINVLNPPGTSLAESERMGIIAEELVLQVPEVASTGRRTGRAEEDDHAEGVHANEIEVDFKPSQRSREAILGDIRKRLDSLPGIAYSVGQPISHRIDHLLSGVRAQIAIKIFGPDLDLLREKATEFEEHLRDVPGVVDLSVEKQILVPQVDIHLNREALKRYGLKVGEVAEMTQAALRGETVSQMLEGERRYDLVVRLDEKSRQNLAAIGQMPIDLPDGSQIPLTAVADIRESEAPNQILRENTRRRIVVQMNVSGRDLGSVVADIQKIARERIALPPGFEVQFGGQFESQQNAMRTMLGLGLLSLIGMAVALYAHFRDIRLTCLVLLNLPFALIGSVAAIWLTHPVMSVGSMVGFITLCGISSRNSILMISHYLHLMRHEGEIFDEKLLVRGALERLVPVAMTSLTAGLALIPLLLAHDAPGKEILYPVAVVIFGGLVSSTLMDIWLMPPLFRWFGARAAARELEAAKNPLQANAGHDDADFKSYSPYFAGEKP